MHSLFKKTLQETEDVSVLRDLLKYCKSTLERAPAESIDLADALFEYVQMLAIKLAVQKSSVANEMHLLARETCHFLAPHVFDRYCLFLEWDREPKKRFYQPRRRVLLPIAQDLQDLNDRKIIFLSVSTPPRVGKLLADETPVLTSQGWKTHGELLVGDEVNAPDGRYVKVQHVFPKDYANMKVVFSNGEEILCHENHEWPTDRGIQETKNLVEGKDWLWNSEGITRVERLETPVQGNCIQVEGGLYRVGKTLLPTHNSTLGCFFVSWQMGKVPDKANVMSGHSDVLTKGFYKEVQSIITDEQYNWKEVFPNVTVAGFSAEAEAINLNTIRRFPTLTCRSIGGTLTGAVEVGNLLYCDDLIEDFEEAVNPDRLDAKYNAYANQLKDRMLMNTIQLMIGTRWAPRDVQGRIQEQYQDNPLYRFRVIPALDENDESNFVYEYGLGFDTAYYMDMKESIDDITFGAKYMGNPAPREGLLYPENELKYYNGTLPDGDPVIYAPCDVAWGGGNHLSMPFLYQYGEDVYVHDVVYNSGDKGITRPLVISKILQHHPAFTRFEANNGGHEYADEVNRQLKELGYRFNISSRTAPTTSSKLVRMLNGAIIARNWYFLDRSHRSSEYKKFMRDLTLFNQSGIGKQMDDAPDSLAQGTEMLYRGLAKVEAIARPF